MCVHQSETQCFVHAYQNAAINVGFYSNITHVQRYGAPWESSETSSKFIDMIEGVNLSKWTLLRGFSFKLIAVRR